MKFHRLFLQGVRALLGIRKRRNLPPTSPKPDSRARICSGNVRIQVPVGMSDELWQWLSALGWRKITFRPDRRRYIDISDAWAKRLCEAPSQQWPQILFDATVAARAGAPHPDAFSEVPMKRQGHRLSHSGRPKR